MSQADLAKKLPFTASRVSRIESGDIALTDTDAEEIATAIETPEAKAFADYLRQAWRILEKPAFDHVSREVLWKAECALSLLRELENDPELKNAFLEQVRSCATALTSAANFVFSTQHQIAFFGSPGVGKTTAICALSGMEKQEQKELKRKMVLPTGSGRITICEVLVRSAGDYSIIVDPCSIDEVRQYVADFSDQLIRSAKGAAADVAGETAGVSTEIERALRNMSGLRKKTTRSADGKIKREDPALELVAAYPAKEDLHVQILSRMELPRRVQTSVSMPRQSTIKGLDWLERAFAEINDGKNPEFSLPQRIEVTVPSAIFEATDLELCLIDTRGIDEPSAPRRDIQGYLDDPRTLAVFCSSFKDAPDAAMLALFERAKETGLGGSLPGKGILLVLPLDREESDVHDNVSGDVDEGREIRREQISTTLDHLHISGLQIAFLRALDESDRDSVRGELIGGVRRIRSRYEDQIKTLIATVEGLISNKANEQAKAVFVAATRPLHIWFASNQQLPSINRQPPETLLQEMDSLRYAASLRASVNRFGDWYNFDYWHCLGVGARRAVVTRTAELATVLKGIVVNALNDADLGQAHDFLRHFQTQVDALFTQLYQDVQALGESAFLDQLKTDLAYWSECSGRWGQGPGYKSDIRQWTDTWFSNREHQRRCEFIESEIQRMWRELLNKLSEQITSAQPDESARAA